MTLPINSQRVAIFQDVLNVMRRAGRSPNQWQLAEAEQVERFRHLLDLLAISYPQYNISLLQSLSSVPDYSCSIPVIHEFYHSANRSWNKVMAIELDRILLDRAKEGKLSRSDLGDLPLSVSEMLQRLNIEMMPERDRKKLDEHLNSILGFFSMNLTKKEREQILPGLVTSENLPVCARVEALKYSYPQQEAIGIELLKRSLLLYVDDVDRGNIVRSFEVASKYRIRQLIPLIEGYLHHEFPAIVKAANRTIAKIESVERLQ